MQDDRVEKVPGRPFGRFIPLIDDADLMEELRSLVIKVSPGSNGTRYGAAWKTFEFRFRYQRGFYYFDIAVDANEEDKRRIKEIVQENCFKIRESEFIKSSVRAN